MNLAIPQANLELLHSDSILLEKTVNQLVKDFETHSVHFKLGDNPTFEILFKELQNVCEAMLNQNISLLLKLIYTIDIEEYRFKKLLRSAEETNVSYELAVLILKRELQKVVIRAHNKSPF